MAFGAYRAAIERLDSLRHLETPWDHHSPQSLRASLERTRQLLRRIGSPEKQMRYIHVTGTSGKGSVTALIHDMLLAHGQRVASSISPHTTTYLERFRIGDTLAAPATLAKTIHQVLDAYQTHLRSGRSPLTSFELTTCIALRMFADARVTWCVLEVGMGGRWDATNVIPSPAVAVVTNIDLDHTHVLGRNRESIAREKAGIIKRGSHVVIGEQRRNLRAIFAKATDKVGASIEYVKQEGDDHRLHNALVATRAALAVGVPLAAVETALAAHHPLPCRLETVQRKPHVILDGAHNLAKINATVARTQGNVHVIFGCKTSKNAKAMLLALLPLAKSVRTTRSFHASHPHDPFALEKLVPRKLRAGAFLFPHDALEDALAKAKAQDVILVTGSLALAGELRTRWVKEDDILRTRRTRSA